MLAAGELTDTVIGGAKGFCWRYIQINHSSPASMVSEQVGVANSRWRQSATTRFSQATSR